MSAPSHGVQRIVLGTVLIAVLGLISGHLQAEPVSLEHDGLILLGHYEPPPEGAPVVLMLHGTLAHDEMEIMSTLRDVFVEEGWGALTVSLSLGESERRGMYPCESLHRHRATDATTELALWRDWLGRRGVDRVVLLGHSRGALQMARYAVAGEDPATEALVLVAPPAASADGRAARYQARFGADLDARLAEAEALVATGRGDQPMPGVGFLYCEDATVTAESFVSYYGPESEIGAGALIEKAPYPVLVVAGSEDEVAGNLVAVLAAGLRPPRQLLIEIEGADHFFRDLYAYDLVEAVIGFVDDMAAP